MTTLLLALFFPQAQAFEPDSLRAEASFGLFRDEYDFLREPAMLAEQDGRHIYTVLGNQGGDERFSFGYLGGAGPGMLGVIVSGTGRDNDQRTTTETAPTAVAGEGLTTMHSGSRVRKLGLFAGYGLPITDVFSLGAGLELRREGREWTLAPNPGDTPLIGGSLRNVVVDDDLAWFEDGRWRVRDREDRAILGAAMHLATFEAELDLHLARRHLSARGHAVRVTDDAEYAFQGFFPGATVMDNLVGVVPGVALDAMWHPSDLLTLRFFAEVERGGMDLVVREAFEGGSDYSDPAAPTRWERSTWLTDPDLRVAETFGLLALHVNGEPVATRFGIAFEADIHDLAVTRNVETRNGTVLDETSRRESTLHRFRAVSLPVAVEITASPRWKVRAGGRYVHAWLDLDGETLLLDDPDEGQTVRTGLSSRDMLTFVQLAAGFRFDVADAFSLDAVATGVGVPGEQRTAIDLNQVLISGVFRLP